MSQTSVAVGCRMEPANFDVLVQVDHLQRFFAIFSRLNDNILAIQHVEFLGRNDQVETQKMHCQ